VAGKPTSGGLLGAYCFRWKEKGMSKGPEPTTVISSEQGWGLIWEELKRVDIAQGRGGPFEGGILWGQNANQAIQSLRDLRLPLLAVHHIGLLIQATIHAAEARFRSAK
jgi:hypothetical protein